MMDWGGYTVGSFAPKNRLAFADVAKQVSPVYVTVLTPNGPTTPNGQAKSIAGHRYGNHRWTDPYQPPIVAYPLVPKPLNAADAQTNPNKVFRLRGFTENVPLVNTAITQILAKKSTGQY